MHGNFSTELKWAERAGFVATLLTAVITARFGWMQGEDMPTRIAYAAGLSICSFLVGYALVFAWRSYKMALPAVITNACVAVFCVAVCVEMLSHVGSAASARMHDMETASVKTNGYNDTRLNLEEARNELSSLPRSRPSGTITAEIEKMKTRKGWDESKGCSDVGSYPTLCRAVGSLRAELATAQQRDSLTARIEKLSTASAGAEMGHSVVDSQTSYVASLLNGTTQPTKDEKYWTNSNVTLLLGLYFVMMGLVNLIVAAIKSEMAPTSAPAARAVPANVHAFHATTAPAYPAPAIPDASSMKLSGVTGVARVIAA